MIHVCGERQRADPGSGVGLGLREAVHPLHARAPHDDDERHPHQPGVGEVHRVNGQLDERGGHADDDHERNEQLAGRDAEVAAGGVQPEREALLRSG